MIGAPLPGSLVPHVRTRRLLLREPRLTDFSAFAANAEDPEAWPIDRDRVTSTREAWRRFHAAAGSWLLHGMGWWIVEANELGGVGVVGVFRRETGPDIEMGWSIYRRHWNKGFASEAARAALDFAVETLAADRVIAYVAKENRASMRVATKIGMLFQGEAAFYGDPSSLYVFERRT